MNDITEILTIIIKIAALLISALLIPYIQTKWKGQKLETVQKWLEIACNAAEEAERTGLIDKKQKYSYAKNILESRGVTFDADTMQALIDSTCWELFNQFKEDSEAPGGNE